MPVVDDLLLGFLLYQSRLVPRILPLLAFTGAALLVASDVGVLFSLWGQFSALGVWLVVKGFQPSPILSSDTRDASAATATNPSASRRP